MKKEPDIESIEIKDIRSSEHVSEKNPPLSEEHPKIEQLSIREDHSDSEDLDEILGSDSEEIEEQKQLMLLEKIQFPQIRTVFKDIESNYLLQCINSAQELQEKYQFKFRQPCKSDLLLTKELLNWTLPNEDDYKMEVAIKTRMI